MEKNIQDLFEFIDRAVKSRKYQESTAQGLRAALKLFDAVLNEEERRSLDLFKKNFEQIYHGVTVKNGKTFSAGSLAAYKSRVTKIVGDFEKYGADPTKMASWSPKVIVRGPRKNLGGHVESKNVEVSQDNDFSTLNNFHVFEFGDVKLVIKKTPKTEEAILAGKFSETRTKLKQIADELTEGDELLADLDK